MPSCSAPKCQNRVEQGFKLYRFPNSEKDAQRRATWLHNCKHADSKGGIWNPKSDNFKICEVGNLLCYADVARTLCWVCFLNSYAL